MNSSDTEKLVDRLLRLRDVHYDNHKVLYLVALHYPEVKELWNLTCPFCKRKFKSKKWLSKHLYVDRGCRVMYSMLVKEITKTYFEFRKVLSVASYRGSPRIRVKGYNYYATSYEEAFEMFLKLYKANNKAGDDGGVVLKSV